MVGEVVMCDLILGYPWAYSDSDWSHWRLVSESWQLGGRRHTTHQRIGIGIGTDFGRREYMVNRSLRLNLTFEIRSYSVRQVSRHHFHNVFGSQKRSPSTSGFRYLGADPLIRSFPMSLNYSSWFCIIFLLL